MATSPVRFRHPTSCAPNCPGSAWSRDTGCWNWAPAADTPPHCCASGSATATSRRWRSTRSCPPARAGNLAKAGYHPEVVCGDGLAGRPASGPFDRVIATAAVRHVPRAWLDQCTDGAVILTPFGTCFANGGLLRLTVAHGRATGRFAGTARYMWVRSERPSRELHPPETGRRAASPLDPGKVMGGPWAQNFALGLWVPDVGHAHRGEGEERQVQFWDQTGTSVTLVSYGGWYEPTAVVAYGPGDLWSEVVAAYTSWRTAGQPDLGRFGITLSDRAQYTWRDNPETVIAEHRS
ncbi:hypothetical protein E4198_22115 [Streptomyces sp. RKND-216]|uniref:protein-L-isoaspartate O-methyltransferase family protein n=1 Tax=Streptomyces sp. RKND-216 TaxID=2562581 RepID=UPI00109E173A|nr:hypothetical protein [Streptomyces sp. RKND-216]THA26992.1 hypothetical protein E4198_22115 [Streptomyces sp. RKND-216]